MIINEDKVRTLIKEELTKGDVRSIIDSEIHDFMKSREFKKIINNMSVDILNDVLDTFWRRKSILNGLLKKM